MFYVGYFSWVGEKPEILTAYWPKGTFTCFVEAGSVDEAGEKLRELIEDAKGWAVPLEDVVHVHVDGLIEVKQLPEQGVVALFQEVDDEGGTMSAALPGIGPEFCNFYLPRNTSDEEDEHGVLIETPFVSFAEEDDEPPEP